MSTDTTTETSAMARLRAAREAAAELDAASAPADTNDAPRLVQAGDVIHAVATGLSISRTASLWGGLPPLNLTRGDRIVVTSEMIEADVDRNGDPGWTALVFDPERQVRRWGRVHLAAGEPPADMQPWEYGDPEWAEAREAARKAAHAETDPQRRAAALAEVHRRFGPAPTTSTITATIRGDSDADAQAKRIAEAAAAGVPNQFGGTAS